MRPFRRHLTYANVLATLAAIIVLIGGTAVAANQLDRSSVGKKQLKAKSVTAAKLKKNAITTAKIKQAAVTGAKVKSASLGDAELATSVPFSRVVQELRGSTALSLPNEPGGKYVTYPLSGTYIQEAGRSDTYVGYADVTLSSTCTNPRVFAFLLIDPKKPGEISMSDLGAIAGLGLIEEAGNVSVSRRINIGTFPGGGTRIAPTSPTARNLVLALKAECTAGEGVTVTDAGVDVIGTK